MDVHQHFGSECPTPLPEGKTSTPMPKDKASQDPTNFGSAPEGNVGIAVGRGRGRGFPKKEPGNSRRVILGKTAEQSPSQHKNERNFKTEDHQESKMSCSHQQLKIPESMSKATLPSSSTTHPENRDVGRGQDFRSSEAGQYIRGQEKDLTRSEDTETTICDQKKEEGDDLTKDPSGTASEEHKECGMESDNDHTEDCQEPDRSNSLQQQRKLETPTENIPPSSLSSAPSGGQESGSDHDRGGDKTGQTNRDQMEDTAVTENKKAPSWGQKQEETENLPPDQSTVTDPADSQWRGMSSPEGCMMQENTTDDSGLGDNSLASRENDSAIRSSEKTGEAAQLEMIGEEQQTTIHRLQEENHRLHGEAAQLETNGEEQQTTIHQLQEENQRLHGEAAQLETNGEEQQTTIHRLQEENQRLHEIARKLQEVENQLQEKKTVNEELKEKIQHLEDPLAWATDALSIPWRGILGVTLMNTSKQLNRALLRYHQHPRRWLNFGRPCLLALLFPPVEKWIQKSPSCVVVTMGMAGALPPVQLWATLPPVQMWVVLPPVQLWVTLPPAHLWVTLLPVWLRVDLPPAQLWVALLPVQLWMALLPAQLWMTLLPVQLFVALSPVQLFAKLT
ncbi:hypothetical protein ACOMHN_033065 [Nucella lapillus]